MRRIILIFIILTLSTCSKKTSESVTELGKSRSEQLKEIPYRGEIINDSVSNSITKTIKHVIERTESLNEVAIFYVTEQGDLQRLAGNWSNGTKAINEADDIWRNINLIMTIVIYPSYSQNAVTGETKEIWAIEVNHKSISRTCRMFFDTPTPTELTNLVD
jgi:hypothetical protein